MIRAFLVALLLTTHAPAAPAQPHDPAHPGSDRYTYGSRRYQVAGAGGFGLVYYLPVPRPGSAAGRYPVLVFAHGKQLYGDSLLAAGRPLDTFYAGFLEHLARKGYVAAFPQMEAGLLDGDRPAQAARFLAAIRWLGTHVPVADTRRLVFAGHSMGADVALLAAVLAARTPGQVVPRAVLAMAPVDEAVVHRALAGLPHAVSVTFVAGDRDTVAPASGSVSLWATLGGHRHQVIRADHRYRGTPAADRRPQPLHHRRQPPCRARRRAEARRAGLVWHLEAGGGATRLQLPPRRRPLDLGHRAPGWRHRWGRAASSLQGPALNRAAWPAGLIE